MSVSAPIFDPSLHEYLCRLGQRIHERGGLLTQSIGQLSDYELDRLTDEDEVDFRALAELRATTLAEIRAKAAPLANRELENCITFGELALILSILADLTR